MIRRTWVLWLLLLTILARTVSAATPVYDFSIGETTDLPDVSVSMVMQDDHCGTPEIPSQADAKSDCSDGETCIADCTMAGCFLMALPLSTIFVPEPTPMFFQSGQITADPFSLHFPFLRPPIV